MGALRNMNNQTREIANKKFKELLISGAFPEVKYEENPGMYGGKSVSYSMIEYSTVWATFSRVVQDGLVAKGFQFGLWQNARNKVYLAAVSEVTSGITEKQVNENSSKRFRTMWD